MQKLTFSVFLIFIFTASFGQKKPLDHTVYDQWESIGRRAISNDGKWIVYNVDVQEGDNNLVIQSSDLSHKTIIPRGSNAVITEDNRFVILAIKPFYKNTREEKIKKKKPEDQMKDSIMIVELGTQNTWKKADIKSFKTPDEGSGWLAYQLEKTKDSTKSTKSKKDNKVTDSLKQVIDSLKNLLGVKEDIKLSKGKTTQNPVDGFGGMNFADFSNFDPVDEPSDKNAGTDLILRNLLTKEERVFHSIAEFNFNKKGGYLLMEQTANPKDSLSKPLIILLNIAQNKIDTLSRGGNDFKNFLISDDGSQIAFEAERDAKPKALQTFYKLWYFKTGMDSAKALVDIHSDGINTGMTVSENAKLEFSKSGNRLSFGTAPVRAPKDTNLVEMDMAKLDIWNYKDDYLQPLQLVRLKQDLQKSYFAIYDFDKDKMTQLGSEEIPTIITTKELEGNYAVGITDIGRRTESQWTGNTKKDIYRINMNDGAKKLIKKDLSGVLPRSGISPTGKYIVWYDYDKKNYYSYDGTKELNITGKIKVPLYEEDNDQPADPGPYGVMGWSDGDDYLLIYDRYDIWKVSVSNQKDPQNITNGLGRKNKITYRYLQTDRDENFIDSKNKNLISVFNNVSKKSGITFLIQNKLTNDLPTATFSNQAYDFGTIAKAKNTNTYIYTKENYEHSPDLYVYQAGNNDQQLSFINPQQSQYNWGTAKLYNWKTFTGKTSTGILYKPEDFDSTKSYPMIMYFYEKLSDGLYKYIAPAPTPSRLNISFFVSRGYIVFAPDIEYVIGHPAKSAYDYIVSAAQDLAKKKWIDGKNIGIQGQSWGGIQVAQLVTMTNMFKAAWAGAPVANMTSAYGGIRWGSGMNRQFQYEKTQSRIGATLWEKPELYIENSPLFHLPKVSTPLVIMSNDADGSVPWYQGIELFTAMVRLGKPAWLLDYNGDDHNLVQRRNRKDISIREQQYFDWLLKGAKPPRWITEGVPAVNKGIDWGLELEK